MPKWFRMRALAESAAEILVYDEIGSSPDGQGLSAKQFDADLKALGAVSQITLRINSPGGDVCEGIAIYNTLKAHPATITARIDGIAASAASLIAMAADRIEMPANAFLLIHEPRIGIMLGTAADLTQAAADLGVMNEAFLTAYVERTGGDRDAIAAMMAEDRLMSAAEAKALGFADAIIETVRITASYDLTKLPSQARAVVAAALKGRTMTKRATASKARAADDDADDKDTLQDMQKQIDALAKKLAAISDEDEDTDDATASDEDGQSDADTDAPADDQTADDVAADTDEDAEDKPASKAKGKARAARQGRTHAAVRQEAIAYAQQVAETCNLAGFPDKAAGYIASGKSMAEVRSDLLKARASQAAGSIAGHHAYGGARGNAAAVEDAKGWDSAVAKVTARARRGKAKRG